MIQKFKKRDMRNYNIDQKSICLPLITSYLMISSDFTTIETL